MRGKQIFRISRKMKFAGVMLFAVIVSAAALVAIFVKKPEKVAALVDTTPGKIVQLPADEGIVFDGTQHIDTGIGGQTARGFSFDYQLSSRVNPALSFWFGVLQSSDPTGTRGGEVQWLSAGLYGNQGFVNRVNYNPNNYVSPATMGNTSRNVLSMTGTAPNTLGSIAVNGSTLTGSQDSQFPNSGNDSTGATSYVQRTNATVWLGSLNIVDENNNSGDYLTTNLGATEAQAQNYRFIGNVYNFKLTDQNNATILNYVPAVKCVDATQTLLYGFENTVDGTFNVQNAGNAFTGTVAHTYAEMCSTPPAPEIPSVTINQHDNFAKTPQLAESLQKVLDQYGEAAGLPKGSLVLNSITDNGDGTFAVSITNTEIPKTFDLSAHYTGDLDVDTVGTYKITWQLDFDGTWLGDVNVIVVPVSTPTNPTDPAQPPVELTPETPTEVIPTAPATGFREDKLRN